MRRARPGVCRTAAAPDARQAPPRAHDLGRAGGGAPRPQRPTETSDYRIAGCRPVNRVTSRTQAARRAMTGGNLLSACPRAELRGPAGRPAGLHDPPGDRSPDSRIVAGRQSLPVSARPLGRDGSLACATLPRCERLRPDGRTGSAASAELPWRKHPTGHGDRRPSAPACRPLPAYSGGTVWDSHPLPGIVGSRAVASQYSTPPTAPAAGPADRARRRAGVHRGLGRYRRTRRHSSESPAPRSPRYLPRPAPTTPRRALFEVLLEVMSGGAAIRRARGRAPRRPDPPIPAPRPTCSRAPR